MPRYDYNQLRYRVDLADPRLVMPVPLYDRQAPAPAPTPSGDIGVGEFVTRHGLRPSTPDRVPTLYAHDRPTPEGIPGGVPVHWSGARCAGAVLVVTDPATAREGSDFVTVEVVADSDQDGDGVYDSQDNCALHPNPSQLDVDADGFGNRCDGDLDQNGVLDIVDVSIFCDVSDMCATPGNPTYLAEADFNGDGVIDQTDFDLLQTMVPVRLGPSGLACAGNVPCLDPLADQDGDGVLNGTDNCSQRPNADQRDTNGDGYGNECDADYDGDGDVDSNDLAILIDHLGSIEGDGTYEPDVDLGGDGVIGVPDFVRLSVLFGKPPGPSGSSW